MAQNHSIGSVTLEVRASHRADGFALQQEMSRWFWDEFLPVLDDLLSELAPEGELIRLDQLNLRIPALNARQWRRELSHVVIAALREQLERLIRQYEAGGAGSSAGRIPLALGHFEAWLWFLEHGQLPVPYSGAVEEERLRAVLESIAAQTSALNRFLDLLRRLPVALQRLVLQHDVVFLTQLTTAVTGRAMAALAQQPSALHAMLSGTPLRDIVRPTLPQVIRPGGEAISVRQLEIRFWQEVFERVANGPQQFDSQIFITDFFEKQFEKIFSVPFETALKQAATVTVPTEDQAEKSPFEQWLRFLQSGQFSSASGGGTTSDLLSAVLETIASEPSAIRQLNHLIRHRPKALQRLVLEHDVAFLIRLVETVTGKKAGTFSRLSAVFYRALKSRAVQELVKQALPRTAVFNAVVIPDTSFEIWYWQELLTASTSDAKTFDDQAFVNAFFKRAFALIYRISYEALVENMLQQAAFSNEQQTAILQSLARIERHFAYTAVLKAFFQQEMEPLREQLQQAGTETGAGSSLPVPSPEAVAIPDQTDTPPGGHLEAWMWFLQYGTLPTGFDASATSEPKRLAAVLEILATRRSALQALRRLVQRQPAAMERLIFQHQPAFLAALAGILSEGQDLPHLPQQAGALYAFLSGTPVQQLVQPALPHAIPFVPSALERRQWEIRFWYELLAALTGKPKVFDYQNFITNFYDWSFQRVFKIPFPQWVQRAVRLATSAAKKRAALLRYLEAASRQLPDDEVLRIYLSSEWDQLREALVGALPQSGASPVSPPGDLPDTSVTRGDDTRQAEIPSPSGAQLPPDEQIVTKPATGGDERKTPATEPPKVQYLQNAGLVMLHPFLVPLFQATGIIKEKQFADEEGRARGVQLLHYLATGSGDAPEYALGIPKLLCGMAHDMPVDRQSLLSKSDLEEGDAMLQAVIGHWGALGEVSNDSLREGFLQREGKLSRRDGDWLLQVESKVLDILMSRLPWGLGVVKLPWMPEILHVEWC